MASISVHDQVRFLLLDQRAQSGAVCHVDHVGAMRDLVSGRVGVAIDRDGFHAEALQCNDNFLAQLAAAEQHDFGGRRSERRAEGKWFHLSSHSKWFRALKLNEIIHAEVWIFFARKSE